jgi:hypothetical protein
MAQVNKDPNIAFQSTGSWEMLQGDATGWLGPSTSSGPENEDMVQLRRSSLTHMVLGPEVWSWNFINLS